MRSRGQQSVVAMAVVTAAAVAAALLLVVASLAGTDGAAQVAHADFWSGHPFRSLDLRWYAGTASWGYSLLAPPLVAALGTRVAGALCAVLAAAGLVVLLVRAGVRRPRLAAAVGGVSLCGNLPTGRTAFALGTAFGLTTLVLAGHRPADRTCAAGPTAAAHLAPALGRLLSVPTVSAAAAVLGSATTLASPVAGLFLALAGVACALTGRPRTGLLVAGSAAVPLVVLQLGYGDGGRMPFAWGVAWPPLVAALAVAVLAEPRHRTVRVGAGIYAAGVLVTYAHPAALGSNVERLGLLLAAPLLAGTAVLPTVPEWRRRPGPVRRTDGQRARRWVSVVLVLAATGQALRWQATVPLRDLRNTSHELPEAAFAPLRAALAGDRTGRVEAVPLRNHAEAALLARDILLARGWNRQVDLADNALLYRGPLDPSAYRRWLDARAVHYVALADAPLDWSAGPESALLANPPDYLEPVPILGRWRLWRVRDPKLLVDPPARLISADAAAVRIQADAPTRALLRLRWSKLLTVSGVACIEPAEPVAGQQGADRWVRVTFRAAGTVTVTSSGLPHRVASCGRP